MQLFLKHACDRVCVLRSLKVAVVVGTILGAVNHYDAILSGTFSATTLVQIGITYLVPFCVATFGSAMQARHIELNSDRE
jgi:cell shape-determining protein MreD